MTLKTEGRNCVDPTEVMPVIRAVAGRDYGTMLFGFCVNTSNADCS